jgi:hypothetical protein
MLDECVQFSTPVRQLAERTRSDSIKNFN